MAGSGQVGPETLRVTRVLDWELAMTGSPYDLGDLHRAAQEWFPQARARRG